MTDAGSSIRALLVDDEPLALDGLELRLSRHADVTVVGKIDDSVQAIEEIANGNANVVFLDIKMPRLDGLRLARVLRGDNAPLIIFTTAFDHYAAEAFEANAVDYLLKPISNVRLDQALDRVRMEMRQSRRAEQSKRLLSILARLQNTLPQDQAKLLTDELSRLDGTAVPVLDVPQGRRTVRVPTADIKFVTADRDYLHIHTGGRSLVMRETMARMAERLDGRQFQRIHRSTIVNMRKVVDYRRDERGRVVLTMESGERLTVGKSYRKGFVDCFGSDSAVGAVGAN